MLRMQPEMPESPEGGNSSELECFLEQWREEIAAKTSSSEETDSSDTDSEEELAGDVPRDFTKREMATILNLRIGMLEERDPPTQAKLLAELRLHVSRVHVKVLKEMAGPGGTRSAVAKAAVLVPPPAGRGSLRDPHLGDIVKELRIMNTHLLAVGSHAETLATMAREKEERNKVASGPSVGGETITEEAVNDQGTQTD
ncbi:MAG: hypothetical protein Q9190_004306 [Brigantiaea leucoxantha]